MTRVYGLIGWPIASSLSPAMHRAAFAATGIDAVYGSFPVAPGTLGDAIRGLRALAIAGANVTVPYKVEVLPLLDAIDDGARAVGAVNTIVRRPDGSLAGTNTDVAGLAAALSAAQISVAGVTAAVVGAGGAARAAVATLRAGGAKEILVVARNLERAGAVGGVPLSLGDARAASATLLINATPAGSDPSLVAALSLPRLAPGTVVVDLSYGGESLLLATARARGLRALDGLGMLLHQGALAFEAWTAVPAPLEAMRRAVRAD